MTELIEKDFRPIEKGRFNSNAIIQPTVSYWKDAWRRLKMNKMSMFALFLLFAFMLLIIFGPNLRGIDYISYNASMKNQSPDSTYWFGLDALGRDLFSRIWVGARVSLVTALICSAIQVVVGCIYGGVMAYFGGGVDNIMMRILEVIISVPGLLITLLIMMVVGSNMQGLIFAMCITSWCSTARRMRGQFMQLREAEYVMAAESLGSKASRIILKHFMPNTMSILIVDIAASIPSYIFTEASLSFLGLGLATPAISLGTLISEGKAKMELFPHQILFPALILCMIVLAFNLFGDGLRDALDPKLR